MNNKVCIQVFSKPETKIELTGMISILSAKGEQVYTGQYLSSILSDPSLLQWCSERLKEGDSKIPFEK